MIEQSTYELYQNQLWILLYIKPQHILNGKGNFQVLIKLILQYKIWLIQFFDGKYKAVLTLANHFHHLDKSLNNLLIPQLPFLPRLMLCR